MSSDATKQSPLMDDTHVFLVEAERRPLKGVTRAWRYAGGDRDDDIVCGWMDLRYRNKNYGEWVGRSVEGHYYKSGVPLNYEGTAIPIGSYFVCSQVEKNLPFCAEGEDLLDEDMVGDRATFETLHPETGERVRFTFWAHQSGFPQFERITNQMVFIAIAATGL